MVRSRRRGILAIFRDSGSDFLLIRDGPFDFVKRVYSTGKRKCNARFSSQRLQRRPLNISRIF